MVSIRIRTVKVRFHTSGYGVTRKRVDGTEVTEDVHDKICSVYRKQFADRGMSCDSAERAWHLLLEGLRLHGISDVEGTGPHNGSSE